jgi:anthranilate phosphoribosyltransferase
MAAAKGAGKTPIQLLLRRLVQTPESITPEDAYNGINYIMNGEATPSQTASFLTALRAHKIDYRPDIVAACGRAMRQQARSVPLQTTNLRSTDIVDIVGTGGDGQDTFNVSTAAGIVASAVGVKVAKVSVIDGVNCLVFKRWMKQC